MAANKILFTLFLLLPFQFSLGSWGDSDLAIIRLIILCVVLGWALESLFKKQIYLPAPLTFFAFTAFLVWASLSLTWVQNPTWAFSKLFFWFNFFPIFLVLISVFQSKELQKSAIKGLVWGGALIGLVGIAEFILQFIIPLTTLAPILFQSLHFFLGANFASVVAQYPSIFVNIGDATFLRAFAFFPDPHIFAYYTAMLIPLAAYLALQPRAKFFEKLALWILVFAALLSFSRASYVALIVTFIILSAVAVWKYKRNLSVPAILIIITLLTVFALSPVTTRLTSSFSIQDGSVSERSRLWQEALVNIKSSPLQGTGLGNYPLLVKPNAEAREPIYVHNLYLDIAVELGLVGLGLFILLIVSCLPKFSFSPHTLLSYRLALLLSLSIFLIHSFFEYPLFSVHILPLFLIILALLYVEKTRV